MQAKLPDINARLVRHMNAAMHAFDMGNFAKAAISFDATNSLLPDDYRLEVNTEKYYEAILGKHMIICRHCDGEFERSKVTPYKLLLSSIDSLILGSKNYMVWDCPNCDYCQPLFGTKIIIERIKQPFYVGIIPYPPKRGGLYDRVEYESKFIEWYDIVTHEIENKIGLYRTDYAAQQTDVVAIDDQMAKLEEEEQ